MRIRTTRRLALGGLASLLISSVSHAQDGKGKAGTPLTVDLPTVAMPLTRNGVLVNYLFGTIQIQVGDAASTFFLRENSFLLRDAIVRVASRTPVPEGLSPRSFDRVAVTRIVMQALHTIRPSTRLVRVTVLNPVFMRN